MFVPPKFKSHSAEDVRSYIKQNAFATLVSTINDKSVASHIPLMYHKKGDEEYLYGHLSASNELSQSFDGKQNLLAIFMESHAYISSSWYDHVNVPTWNYIAVHIYGTATRLEGVSLLNSINDMVNIYEASSKKPFHTSQMQSDELKAHLDGLVGFKMKINSVEAAWKLSQNRNDKNYFEIIKKLRERNDQLSHSIANEMERLRK